MKIGLDMGSTLPQILEFTLYFDNKQTQTGYVYVIGSTTYQPASIAAVITDEGELQLFTYDDQGITDLQEGVDFKITGKVISKSGEIVYPTLSISQPLNSAFAIAGKATINALREDTSQLYSRRIY